MTAATFPRRLLSVLVLTFALSPAFACGMTETLRRGDLDVAVSRHHIDLKWGRIPHAARFVHPDLREAFIEDWERRASAHDIQEIRVVEVYSDPDGVNASVNVEVSLIEKNTQRLLTFKVTERWELIDNHWIAITPLELTAP